MYLLNSVFPFSSPVDPCWCISLICFSLFHAHSYHHVGTRAHVHKHTEWARGATD